METNNAINQPKESELDLRSYDKIVVAFSGGKDSTACVLYLLESGVPKDKIELWHHIIDGREGSTLMDWPVTEDYCRAFARALDIKIYFNWKVGGFEKEMLRKDSPTEATKFEKPGAIVEDWVECGIAGGKSNKTGTRRKFPQVSASLSVRWCSAYLKIDVCDKAIQNQARFNNKRTLVVTGERAEESASRAKYKTFEPDRADNRDGKRVVRHVDHWRPVHSWSEAEVWEIIERNKIQPHPAYVLGWGRLSCMSCIFGSKDQWSSLNAIAPEHVNKIAEYEEEFERTIHRSKSVRDQVNDGTPYPGMKPEIIKQGLSKSYSGEIIVDNWDLPAGAFGENAGPS